MIKFLAWLGSLAVGAFVGVVIEHNRPCGSDWHRRNAIQLARQIANMENQRCCDE